MRKLIRKLHLYLGLISGLIIFIVAITGAIYAFESEVSDLVYPYRHVKKQDAPLLLPSQLTDACKEELNGLNIFRIYYNGEDRPTVIRARGREDGEHVSAMIYQNPYDGTVLKYAKNDPSFFQVVLAIHMNLLLGKIGSQIVAYASLVFLVMLISGIVLWWPKNRSAAKQRFSFKWREGLSWKRKNYDLHNVLGFYASWIMIFVVITGLAWSFEWMNRSVHFLFSPGSKMENWRAVRSPSDSNIEPANNLLDRIYADAVSRYDCPYQRIRMQLPGNDTSACQVMINPSNTTYYKMATYFYDQRNAAFLSHADNHNLDNGSVVQKMYYDIHVGKIMGLPGQLLVFFGGLIIASLPITGLLIWWGRKKKGLYPS